MTTGREEVYSAVSSETSKEARCSTQAERTGQMKRVSETEEDEILLIRQEEVPLYILLLNVKSTCSQCDLLVSLALISIHS